MSQDATKTSAEIAASLNYDHPRASEYLLRVCKGHGMLAEDWPPSGLSFLISERLAIIRGGYFKPTNLGRAVAAELEVAQ